MIKRFIHIAIILAMCLPAFADESSGSSQFDLEFNSSRSGGYYVETAPHVDYIPPANPWSNFPILPAVAELPEETLRNAREMAKTARELAEYKEKMLGRIVWITDTGKRYHGASCRWGYTPIKIGLAIMLGYTPCRVCW